MNRIRLLGLAAIIVISASLLWVISHYRNEEGLVVGQAGGRLGKKTYAQPAARTAGGSRRNFEDRERSRALQEALTGVKREIEVMEVGRIFDRSRSVRSPLIADVLKEHFSRKDTASPVKIEVHQIALDAPTPEQVASIRNLIRDRLPQQLFDDVQQRETAIDEFESRYLNYGDKIKLIEKSVLIVENTGEKHEWISGYDTSEIMQLEKPEGALLSPKTFGQGIDSSIKTEQGGWGRYGYLFKNESGSGK